MKNLLQTIQKSKLENIYFSHYGVDWKSLFDRACKQIKRKVRYQDVEDMAQECLIDVYKEISSKGLRKSIKALQYKIARYKIADRYRNKKNYIKSNGENISRTIQIDKLDLLTEETPEQLYEHEEARARVNLVIDQLTPRNREVLQLMIEGYKDIEIAETLKIQKPSVRSVRSRAIEQARIKYNDMHNFAYL